MEHAVAIREIDTVVADLIALHIERVDTGSVVPHESSVVAIFTIPGIEDQVAILLPSNEVGVLCIDHFTCLQNA